LLRALQFEIGMRFRCRHHDFVTQQDLYIIATAAEGYVRGCMTDRCSDQQSE
jgi:G:T-mismatch repair DNA endonuclease (very short patch repair protein)